jgi:ABC-2 type transport system permease protein
MYLIKIELKKIFQYIENMKINILLMLISLGIQLSIFHIFFYTSVNDKLWLQTIVYVIISGAMYNIISINRVPEFADYIKNGKIVKYFIRPMEIFKQCNLQELGNSLLELLQSLPILIIGIITSSYLFHNMERLPYYIISLMLSIILSTLITNTIFSFTFITMNYSGIKAILQGVNALLSGTIVPLILWPEYLISNLKYSPFALLIDGPIRVYLGIESFRNVIMYQIIWCIIFYLIGKFTFKKMPCYCDYVGG